MRRTNKPGEIAVKAHNASLFRGLYRRYHRGMNNPPKQNAITPFAATNYRDNQKIFGIKEQDRCGHMYLIGKSGTGKSTLLRNLVISDIRNGHGLALIDPHGDLVEDILDHIPPERIKDVIYFNPADLAYPVGFNPIAEVSQDYRPLVASGLLGVFKKVWLEFWGPRLEHILRYTLLTLLDYPGTTLLDVTCLLTQPAFRKEAMFFVNNPDIRDFWRSEFDRYSDRFRTEAISPILNKFGQFAVSAPLRNTLGQAQSAFRFRQVMDEGRIVLCNLAKGKIGEDTSTLLGSMLVSQMQLAAQSRGNIPEQLRRPFYLYVDEVHNFLTLSFADILSEARKYGLHLVLAHQYINQLDPKIRSAIFGNAGTLLAFRVGAEDAQYLAKEFLPVFDDESLVSLPNHHIYLKLMIDGHVSKPFSAVTLPPFTTENSFKSAVIAASRSAHGTPCAKVEQSLNTRH